MTTVDSSVFIKRPSFSALDALQGSGLLANLFLQELEVLELLASRPHPNIVQYYGCQVCRGRIVGLTLEQHPYTLQECLRNGYDLDLVSGQDEIKSAVAHLHSLGLAHNDIRPNNIMVSVERRWILIDMGACKPFGQDLITSGNPDWTTSSKQNDEVALCDLQIMLHHKI
ncbi:hypothetical protein BU26DRAFT_558919 [Trematosphaeria pertusa]|uniref:Protein kinase domain-containing protein n=1 Tax=Trematosphaeria pertusa TaxID=390896 RepID=A0A6A6IUZ7_9PLEO|nr:uncharacterized protein BU26DRAFT_558919 [Trematosphaeria pertusa]KAF2254206.1 hypothetical protein BU26DRAFT_558919 [Trematosphaeria pertusa]